MGLDERNDWIEVTGTDGTPEVTSVDTSLRDGDAGGEGCRYVMLEPVDGDEGESGKRRSSGMRSINAERAPLGEKAFDDEPSESIQ